LSEILDIVNIIPADSTLHSMPFAFTPAGVKSSG